MRLPSSIAIDGPAASGKSTLGEQLAHCLGFLFFDTGIMYRAVTWAVIQSTIDVTDESQVSSLAERIRIDVNQPSVNDGRKADVSIDGEDATWEVRRAEVEANVSVVSAYPRVRAAMTAQQRRIGQRGQVVMVGRDIGTVVLPEADLKIYLDASVEERARRRFDEVTARGETVNYDELLESMRNRDRIDSTRAVAPLRPADDAIVINSDGKTADEILSYVCALAKKE